MAAIELPIAVKEALFHGQADEGREPVPGGLTKRHTMRLSTQWHTYRRRCDSQQEEVVREMSHLIDHLTQMRDRIEAGAQYSDEGSNIMRRTVDLAQKMATLDSAYRDMDVLRSALEVSDLRGLDNPTDDVRICDEVVPSPKRACSKCENDTLICCPVCREPRMCEQCGKCDYCQTEVSIFEDMDKAIIENFSVGTKDGAPKFTKQTAEIRGQLTMCLGLLMLGSTGQFRRHLVSRIPGADDKQVRKLLAKLRDKGLALYDSGQDKWFATIGAAEYSRDVEV